MGEHYYAHDPYCFICNKHVEYSEENYTWLPHWLRGKTVIICNECRNKRDIFNIIDDRNKDPEAWNRLIKKREQWLKNRKSIDQDFVGCCFDSLIPVSHVTTCEEVFRRLTFAIEQYENDYRCKVSPFNLEDFKQIIEYAIGEKCK